MTTCRERYNKLKNFFSDNHVKMQDLAEEMGMSRTQFSKKMNRIGKADFRPDEIRYICRKFNLDANDFFLLIPSLIRNEQRK